MTISDSFQILEPLVGGVLIGLASLMLLAFDGRIAGISGIVGGMLGLPKGDLAWRLAFLAGLLAGGAAILFTLPDAFPTEVSRSTVALVLAGFLVGFGTRMGSGCTSGHGVCGISRLSMRSIVATLTFMATGMATVFVVDHLLGGGS
ncbi:MAG: YeeE/YedE family protein [Deltaproteobacteria bacterium]|nr:MAG: YeeE/YedE family protein [Deltaproteobacteria bacterium]